MLESKRCNYNALKAQGISGPPALPHASADTFQMEALHSRRTYDDRIQEAICESGDRELFPALNIPRSTIRSWIHRGTTEVVTCEFAAHDYAGSFRSRRWFSFTALLRAHEASARPAPRA
jgi:hypothetical protein